MNEVKLFSNVPPLAITLLCSLLGFLAHATTVTNPTLDCATCSGEAIFSSDLPGDVLYEWYDSNGALISAENNDLGSSTINNLCVGSYQVQATNGTTTAFEWFSINTANAALPEVIQHNNCNSGPAIDLAGLFGGTLPAGGQWFSPLGATLPSGSVSPVTAQSGFYTYEFDEDGCTQITGVGLNIVQNANPGLSETYLICETYEPFELNDQLDGADFGGEWFDPNQNPFPGLYSPTIDEPGTYVYRIDTVEFCPAVFSTLTILENTLPNIGTDNSLFVCPGAVQVDLFDYLGGTPDTGGQWYDTNNQVFNGLFDPSIMPEGEYRYRILGAVPCPNQESSVFVEFTNGISAGEGEDYSACLNAPSNLDLGTLLNDNPTLGGQWIAPDGTSVPPVITASTAANGTYTYVVSALGCDDESTSSEVFFELPTSAGPDQNLSFCQSQSMLNETDVFDLALMDTGGSWTANGVALSFPVSFDSFSLPFELNYQLNPVVCPQDESTITINLDEELPDFPDLEFEMCSSDENIIITDLAPEGYSDLLFSSPNPVFDDGIFEPSLLEDGVLTIEVVSNSACPNSSFQSSFSVAELLIASEEISSLNCANGELILLNDFFPAQEDWTLSNWTLDGAPVDDNVAAEIASNGLYVYSYDHGNACGVQSLQLDLSIELSPFAGPDQSYSYCINDDPVNLSEVLTFVAPSAIWNEDFTAEVNIFDPSQGSQSIALVVNEVGPCISDTAWVSLDVDLGVSLNAGDNQILCDGESAALQATQHDGYEYLWTPAQHLDSDNASSANFSIDSGSEFAQDFVYNLSITNGICSFEDELEIVVNPLPELTFMGDLEVCEGEALDLILSGAPAISWEMSDGVQGEGNAVIETPLSSGEMNLNLESAEGCMSVFVLPYLVHENPDANFDASPLTGCIPHEVFVQNLSENEGEVDYFWQIGDDLQNSQDPLPFILEEPGFFDVSLLAVNEWGCQSSQSIEDYIQAYALPSASFELLNESISSDNPTLSVMNASMGATYWSWDLNGNTSFSNDWEPQVQLEYPESSEEFTLCLYLENDFACADSTCRDLLLFTTLNVFVPNAFSPDFDGVNDGFKPVVSGHAPDTYRFLIFNRWGELIFESTDPEELWFGAAERDGSHFSQDGIYQWYLEVADDFTGEMKTFQGHVSILR
jgi:hypothetical protein